MAADADDLTDRPDRVLRDLSLLLSAARVSPILRDAVLRVEAEVTRLRGIELLAETPADEVERLHVIEMAARRYVVAPESCAEACEIAYYGLRRALGVETDA